MKHFLTKNLNQISAGITAALILVLLFGSYQSNVRILDKLAEHERILAALRMEQVSLKSGQEALVSGQDSLTSRTEELRSSTEALKERKPQVVEKIVERVVEKNPTNLSDIIKQWRSRVAYVECEWRYADTGRVYARSSGSAVAAQGSEGVHLITNRHVVTDRRGNGPAECLAKLPDKETIYSFEADDARVSTNRNLDKGFLLVDSADNHIKTVSQNMQVCKSGSAQIGDEVVILGYPSYGSGHDEITATEGIISGRDGEYYTTSAKIESGNSGGAAILRKHNCYLGIPTGVVVGEIESLGRILDVAAAS
jgi:hypothetical protein